MPREVSFALGEVVRHRKFGFVGAIAGWDLRPTADVSRWDGVVGLSLLGEQPFFHVIPDEHDVHQVFGGPRGMRYVAQQNLERVSADERLPVSHSLLRAPEAYDGAAHGSRARFFERFEPASGSYVPDAMLRYLHPEARATSA